MRFRSLSRRDHTTIVAEAEARLLLLTDPDQEGSNSVIFPIVVYLA